MAASLKMEGDGLAAATMMVGIGCWNLSQFLGEFELVPNHCSCGFESVLNQCSCGFELVLNLLIRLSSILSLSLQCSGRY